MSIQVKSIDVYSIHERLRKDKTKAGKEVYNYVQKLNEALKRQQELTALAISKLRRTHKELNEINGIQESVNLYGSDINSFGQNRQGFTEGVAFVLDKLKNIK